MGGTGGAGPVRARPGPLPSWEAVPDPIFRPAAEEEDGAVAALLASAFSDNPKVDAAVRDWQYHSNPYGPPVTWV